MDIQNLILFGTQTWENTDKKNSEYGHFLRNDFCKISYK